MTTASTARRLWAVAGVVASTAGLVACGADGTTPGQDEYAGRAQTQAPAGTGSPTTPGTADQGGGAPAPTGGPYADGQYSVTESYGIVDGVIEEDSIDVTLTLRGGLITQVSVTGSGLTDTSRDFIADFAEEIDGVVVGRSVEDAHVTALAGASKTSEAFNDAVDAIAEQARGSAASSTGSS